MIKDRMAEFYMNVAENVAELSRAERLKVGCVIVKNDNIISFSWNGTPAGWDNCCEDKLECGSLKTKPEVIHSEMNAILKVARGSESTKDSVMFVTHAPCTECAKGIIGSGITEIYYRNDYRDFHGIDMLKKGNIRVTKM